MENAMKGMHAGLIFSLALAAGTVAAQSAGPTDPQIAAIVTVANQVDIDAGKLAESRSKSKDVQAFAKLMVTDHSAVNKSAADLVRKLNVKPESNPTSQSLQQGGDKNLAELKTLSGAAFDKAYVNHEVAYHQAVIDTLDKVRPAFVAHLEHAKQLQAKVSGG
jgi:putative membrane protein